MLERSLQSVPKRIIVLLVISLSLQIMWHYIYPSPLSTTSTLKPPPNIELLRVLSFGEPIASAKIVMLWLQSFNTRNGQLILYRKLDYAILIQWLDSILQLDPKGQYPLLAASHFYSIVPDPSKQRQILDFVYEQFFIDPSRRWLWLAQAAILAQHRLRDLPLALKYTQALAVYAPPSAPYWVREMRVFVLDAMGELKKAESIVKNILASGKTMDADEMTFFTGILKNLQEKLDKSN